MAYNPRSSFRAQMEEQNNNPQRRGSSLIPRTMEEKMKLACEIDEHTDDITAPFVSKFAPTDMRQLALVAHNHMKPAMKEFVETYSEILKKFRITGTNTTMRMCKSLWGEDNPNVVYGLSCTSGPLGGDAQVAALMCMEDLGGLIFFIDPLSAHPHQADIDSLVRLANCGNIVMCINPTSAMSMMHTFKCALEKGVRGAIPSFFETLESPAVEEYKRGQELALKSAIASEKALAKAANNEPNDAPAANARVSFGALPAIDDTPNDAPATTAEDQALNERAYSENIPGFGALSIDDTANSGESAGSDAVVKKSDKKLKPSRGLLGFKSYKVAKSVRHIMSRFDSSEY